MKKRKPKYGYKFITCPICKSKTFDYCSYSEEHWGTVEQHGYCHRCGYVIEQAYSRPVDAFSDITKGFKNILGEYIPKNIKKHKRIRKKLNLQNDIEVNPEWLKYI